MRRATKGALLGAVACLAIGGTARAEGRERTVWGAFAPEVLRFFEPYAAVRASVAAQVDAHTITLEAGTAAIREAAAEFLSQIEALANAEAQARQMRAAQQEQRQAAAQQAEQNDEAARAVLLGIAAYYQTRANMDAAGSAAIAAQPPITHTTCQTNPLFGTVTCTHTPY